MIGEPVRGRTTYKLPFNNRDFFLHENMLVHVNELKPFYLSVADYLCASSVCSNSNVDVLCTILHLVNQYSDMLPR